MSRVQLALNVENIDTAVAFYAELFQVEPAKRRPGYANFAIDDPALKLVLIENRGAGGSLNHLGVEVASTDEVVATTRRLAEAGLPTEVEDGTTCCYALQDKVWATGPGGERWEVYTVLADADADADAGAQWEGKTLAEVASVPAAATSTAVPAASAASPGGAVCCGS